MRQPRAQVNCRSCGRVFLAYVSQRRKFCSNPCRHTALIGLVPPHKGAHLNPDYFWSFVEKSDGCWLWTAHRNAAGYGHISVNGKLKLTHRHAWELTNGPIPAGQFALHHCDNPPCVRPDHLYIGTKRDNARDRQRRGRGGQLSGEKAPSAKLSERQAWEIRERYAAGARQCDLARSFNINYRTVHALVHGLTWRNPNG